MQDEFDSLFATTLGLKWFCHVMNVICAGRIHYHVCATI
jgi:hypothetical protein